MLCESLCGVLLNESAVLIQKNLGRPQVVSLEGILETEQFSSSLNAVEQRTTDPTSHICGVYLYL